MIILEDIIWLDAVAQKLLWKHHVLITEVEEVLAKRCKIFKKENGKVEGENLYNGLGKTNGGRFLSIFFIKKLNKKVLIVTARDMNKNERKRYEAR